MNRGRLLVIAGTCVVLAAAAWGCWLDLFGGRERMATRGVIAAIEAYRGREGRLPDPADAALMQSLGCELREGLYPMYSRVSGTEYVVTVVKGFDPPYWMYESSSGKWRQGFPN